MGKFDMKATTHVHCCLEQIDRDMKKQRQLCQLMVMFRHRDMNARKKIGIRMLDCVPYGPPDRGSGRASNKPTNQKRSTIVGWLAGRMK